jgi:hypothetical protein
VGVWREWRVRELTRLRSEWRGALAWALRITVAASASYVVGTLLFPGTHPLLAPLTAMLVVQVTPVSLLASGVDRVVAVVSGVSLAVAFAAVVPLAWWSLGILVFLSLVVGQVLRLRDNLMEVPISAMLVLGVGSLGVQSFAWQRITETLLGAGVGVAANLLFPPRVPTSDAGREIEGLADALSDLLHRAAASLEELAREHRPLAAASEAWLDQARLITHQDVPRVGATLLRAEQSRRLNVRAVGTPDLGPGLRQGVESMEHAAVAVRSMFRALADAAADDSWAEGESAEDLLLGLAQTLHDLAAAIDAFGALVRLEAAAPNEVPSADLRSLRDGVEGLAEARARLEGLATTHLEGSLAELHSSVLSTVKRVQRELDLDHRMRRQLQLRRSSPTRPALLRARVTRRRGAGRSDGSPGPASEPAAPDGEPGPG